jgi:spore germination protein YaaH
MLVIAAATALAVGASVLVLQQVHPTALPWNRSPLVAAAYLPEWDGASTASLDTAAQHGLSEVSPVWATVDKDGSLALITPPATEAAALQQPGLRVIPTIQNLAAGQWQGTAVADLLGNPAASARHVQAIVRAAVSGHWAGVDIDYEELPPMAGQAFTSFLSNLRDQLHAHHMVLSVAMPARTEDEGAAETLAYPYPLVGRIADEFRVMAYDYSWSTSRPGPVAPLPWVQSVVTYAVARVPRDKLMLGLATYGYDWVGRSGADIGGGDAARLADRQGIRPRWDSSAAASTFTYKKAGRRHTVWYEDSRSIAAKENVAASNGLRGVALWRLGGEDPQIWTTVAAAATGGSAG